MTYFRVSCLNGCAPLPAEDTHPGDFVFDDWVCEEHLPALLKTLFAQAPESSAGGKAVTVRMELRGVWECARCKVA